MFGTGGETYSYWREVATLKNSTVEERMAACGLSPPGPLPGNRDAWSAFLRICHIRHYTMGTPGLPNWSDIRNVLELFDQWAVDIYGRLSICFSELLTMETEARKASNG